MAMLASFGALAVLPSCGGGGSPASSTPPVTVAPQPTPTPSATPAPIGGGDSFNNLSCPYGKGDVNATCQASKPAMVNEVEAAMDVLIQQQPQLFDLTDESPAGSGGFRVKDREAYLVALVNALRTAGLCAERDADDAALQVIRVKQGREYSVDVDTLTSSGYLRRGPSMYRQTCLPAAFPVDRSADAPPFGSGCGRPYPPPVTRFNCKVHIRNSQFYTLDSTPLVGPDADYCASIGYSDRTICPLRPEEAPDRVACENWRVGKAKDTGRPGPTWTKEDGSYCTGPESGCANSPDSQYQLWAYKGGRYRVEAENGVSCTVIVER